MAHLWIQDECGWDAVALVGAQCNLADLASRQTQKATPATIARTGATVVRSNVGGSRLWALITPPGANIRVNSREVHAGLCVLTDRDEIRVDDQTRYFSTETLAAVQPLPESDRPVFCGRCRQQVEAGTPAVCCPNCGIWYNSSPELPCWTYSSKCTFCGHPTALDTGYSWTPEED
jgi:hypothetical protein